MNGLLIYKETAEIFDDLTDAEVGIVFKAALRYAFHDEEPVFTDRLLKVAFNVLRKDIDSSREKYEKVCERNRANGLKGGRPANPDKPTETDTNPLGFDETQSNPMDPKEPKLKPKLKQETKLKDDNNFSEAWDAYPRKQGRKEAEAAYIRAIKAGTSHEEIMKGIRAYNEYLTEKKVEPQYIKQGSTFFRQAAWNDDWTTGKKVHADNRGRVNYSDVARDLFVQEVKNHEVP